MALAYVEKAKRDREKRRSIMNKIIEWDEKRKKDEIPAEKSVIEGKRYSQIDRPPRELFTEKVCPISMVDTSAYVPTKKLVEGLLNAGVAFEENKQQLFDFPEGNIEEELTDRQIDKVNPVPVFIDNPMEIIDVSVLARSTIERLKNQKEEVLNDRNRKAEEIKTSEENKESGGEKEAVGKEKSEGKPETA